MVTKVLFVLIRFYLTKYYASFSGCFHRVDEKSVENIFGGFKLSVGIIACVGSRRANRFRMNRFVLFNLELLRLKPEVFFNICRWTRSAASAFGCGTF